MDLPVNRIASDLTAEDLWFSAWSGSAALAQQPRDLEVQPGLTVGYILDFHTRQETPPGATYQGGRVYGHAGAGGRELTLNLYARRDRSERRPGVIFIHGGGWLEGHPGLHIRHANELARLGYVTGSISYRLHPEGRWPDFLEDAKCAVRWFRTQADDIGLDPDRLAVAGGSAGGHLSAMIALTPGLYEGNGGWADQSSAVNAAVLWYPATDLSLPDGPTEIAENIRNQLFGGSTDLVAEASPINHVSSECPPILSMVGENDALTTPVLLRQFHDRLTQDGVINRLVVYPGMDHAFDFQPLQWLESTAEMVRFLAEHLSP